MNLLVWKTHGEEAEVAVAHEELGGGVLPAARHGGPDADQRRQQQRRHEQHVVRPVEGARHVSGWVRVSVSDRANQKINLAAFKKIEAPERF